MKLKCFIIFLVFAAQFGCAGRQQAKDFNLRLQMVEGNVGSVRDDISEIKSLLVNKNRASSVSVGSVETQNANSFSSEELEKMRQKAGLTSQPVVKESNKSNSGVDFQALASRIARMEAAGGKIIQRVESLEDRVDFGGDIKAAYVYFQPGQTELSDKDFKRSQAGKLPEKNEILEITGHADNTPAKGSMTNQQISDARAAFVAAKLNVQTSSGVPVRGAGETEKYLLSRCVRIFYKEVKQ
ncbi:hypothetical protein CO115_04970 [Candidatus Falkowbacteria bacterium CG_4_9_14_3_um_filter_36_9]|uniref:OmpA-like domain-containing protein n=2 Tax=Candidatus Falkowiibacteriota TaxID=1752728 RepID=A0A1J4T8D0_9BACT|nr:MAG: hypothetical protein AUJ27_03570 [Candidatus Falkowbacteria bacterium CG1_02_37_44]PIV50708.1 MAG: hypothetical protein COS18_04240 [Candidatus Falkowbacteria bacterium CG02_land_8_20_14_3_00_36_14]PIX11320.1 MAG: hypothetical protein COZ73_02905 [Candidatus Falkowbacteria bacterium CG_4_8_14_3_um_filter_36_11]PJA10492.1 MAG: hypothetical protein COX67_04420 [Candidatus Falkowbacteria bacterium CG_4_10_14_0_2_um_filter_36_22]PJB18156.1 MAG: hypothetical protein CO115_04970 [Candidatus F